jgi:cyclic pyranopterin phosphate synthase
VGLDACFLTQGAHRRPRSRGDSSVCGDAAPKSKTRSTASHPILGFLSAPSTIAPSAAKPGDPPGVWPPLDRLKRPLLDLRLSVTDRCEFRCAYCRPPGATPATPVLARSELLSFEEIERLARVFAALGVRKIRLTGGEPLLRAGLVDLVRRLAPLVDDLALTTNGARLAGMAEPLARAGLRRVSVSLDALDDDTYRRVSGTALTPARILEGIEAAEWAGLGPVKINVVVLRRVNEEAALEIARRFRGTSRVVRFIERMEATPRNRQGTERGVTAGAIQQRLAAIAELRPMPRRSAFEVAERWFWVDGGGEIGFITSVSRPFCRECSRGRLSADGRFFTCLFARDGFDLRGPLRAGASSTDIEALVRDVWAGREDRHCEARAEGKAASAAAQMAFLGG